VPQDGRIKRAGYCNLASVKRRMSFARLKPFYWDLGFTDLILWVRGDGRTYQLNLHCPGDVDLEWLDAWSFPFFTRGGPYWQYVRIPFSKFYFNHRATIQDKQVRVPLIHVQSLSFTLADRTDGPFSLEIDKIGVYKAPYEMEKFRYESYHFPVKNWNANYR